MHLIDWSEREWMVGVTAAAHYLTTKRNSPSERHIVSVKYETNDKLLLRQLQL